jgi:hypothetical protein
MFADFAEKARHFRAAHFLVRHFAAAMKNHGANFVALAEEADDLILANLIIVLGGGGPELHFLERRTPAAFALFVRLLVRLVEKLTIIGDFANGRVRRRRNLHQIQTALTSEADRFKGLHNAELGAFFVNHTDFARSNPVIDADSITLPEIPFRDNSPLRKMKAPELPNRGERARL